MSYCACITMFQLLTITFQPSVNICLAEVTIDSLQARREMITIRVNSEKTTTLQVSTPRIKTPLRQSSTITRTCHQPTLEEPSSWTNFSTINTPLFVKKTLLSICVKNRLAIGIMALALPFKHGSNRRFLIFGVGESIFSLVRFLDAISYFRSNSSPFPFDRRRSYAFVQSYYLLAPDGVHMFFNLGLLQNMKLPCIIAIQLNVSNPSSATPSFLHTSRLSPTKYGRCACRLFGYTRIGCREITLGIYRYVNYSQNLALF